MADPFESVPATQPTSWPEATRTLCRCGNPDNCACPPVTAEDLAARIVRWTTDGKPNVRAGDQILDQGEMCTVEDVYVETLISDGSPWLHVMLRDPRAANTGLPVHAAGFSGMGFVAVRSAALAGDPGDLPARMADALLDALQRWDTSLSGAQVDEQKQDYLARVALSVRWEHAAHLAARVGDAERRAEKAEGQLSALRDHETRWEAEKARADQLRLERNEWRSRVKDLDGERIAAEQRAGRAETEAQQWRTLAEDETTEESDRG